MKNKFFLIVAMIGIVVTSSCTKKPEASISTSTKDAKVNQSVKFTSTSKNAKSVKWTFPDGQTFNSNEVDFTFTSPGDKQVKLEAFSKNQKKKSETSVVIKVEEDTGDLTMWLEDDVDLDDVYEVWVSLNDDWKDISDFLEFQPQCNDINCANFKSITAGTHTIYVYIVLNDGSEEEGSFNFTIEGGKCKVANLRDYIQ
ncbi:hypothetical protein FLAV_00356 [Flavobacteriales bacterium]|nr:hypothetical protein FLAV_00356 [Flavobacteriales bacterium]